MCGIAGFVESSQSNRSESVIAGMLKSLEHRGPDGEGVWRSKPSKWTATLGHRRLSIIDLERGRQPLGNEDDKVQVTFNGEIFNFQELIPGLIDRAHKFKTRSDTEVIVHNYEEHGIEGLRALNGMFAFAIWDDEEQSLLLARDRAGIKPLYYSELPDGGVAFASELTALLKHPKVPRGYNQYAIRNYFFADYIRPPTTAIEGVLKLPPGHFVIWKDGKLSQPEAFWKIEDVGRLPELFATENEAVQALTELLETATRRQLIADVPVGIFLSGGIDSSLVTAFASKQKRGLQTFSVTFEDPEYDEGPAAKAIADKFKTVHRTRTLNEKILLESIDRALTALDEPMADPSIVPTYLLSELAAKHVKVVLGGDGGDELWAGYPTYRAHKVSAIYGIMPALMRDQVIKPLVSMLPTQPSRQSFEWKLKRFTGRWDKNPNVRHLRWMSNTDLPELQAAFTHELDGSPVGADLANFDFGRDDLNRYLALDFITYMSGSVLTKVDRASMAHGLEVRPPLLDNELIEFAYRVPFSMKLKGGVSKYLIKKLARELLPPEILKLPKRGFGIPVNKWVRGPLKTRVESILGGDSPVWTGAGLKIETFRLWNEQHQELKRDHSKTLWALIALDHWMKRC
ncbi:MAG TPA: asparagine synthase (glutamine-hydrolyzing) [Bdellovibrionales bacterium]|nr:asparagine synthase (glutamine-hydrolyzing) [Bdellovibrionales bacterium]